MALPPQILGQMTHICNRFPRFARHSLAPPCFSTHDLGHILHLGQKRGLHAPARSCQNPAENGYQVLPDGSIVNIVALRTPGLRSFYRTQTAPSATPSRSPKPMLILASNARLSRKSAPNPKANRRSVPPGPE